MKARWKQLAAVCAVAFVAWSANATAQVLKINLDMDPPHVDPILYQENISSRVLRDIYESFTWSDETGANHPALAKSWEPLTGGRTGFRFFLRDNAVFHTGRKFTAKDVKFTLEYMLNPASKAGNADLLQTIVGAQAVKAGTAKDLEGVKIVNDLTVDVEFTELNPSFPIATIQFVDSEFVKEHGAEWFNKGSAGTGPFKFSRWQRGSRVELLAHDAYWGGKPKVSGVTYLIIPSPETVLAQYDANELHVADLQESMFGQVFTDARYKNQLMSGMRASLYWMGMNPEAYAPFKDKRVREAVSLAIDRDAIIKGLFKGAATSFDGVVPPGLNGYTNELPKLAYDPARAKKLLAEAGYPDGKGMPPVTITGWPVIKDLVTYYAAQLNAVLGMPVTPNIIERTTWIKSANAGELPFFPSRWTAAYMDPVQFLDLMWHSKSRFNRAKWKNAEFDSLIERARVTSDNTARMALFKQAETMVLADWAGFSLPVPVTAGLVKPNVKGIKSSPSGYLEIRGATIQ